MTGKRFAIKQGSCSDKVLIVFPGICELRRY